MRVNCQDRYDPTGIATAAGHRYGSTGGTYVSV